MKESKIRGLLIKPNCKPEVIEYDNDYREMQRLVEGHFELAAFYRDVDLFVNDEGKFNGSAPNKMVYYQGRLVDVIYGNILIVDSNAEGDTISLTDDKIKKYKAIFSKEAIHI